MLHRQMKKWQNLLVSSIVLIYALSQGMYRVYCVMISARMYGTTSMSQYVRRLVLVCALIYVFMFEDFVFILYDTVLSVRYRYIVCSI